MKPDRFERNVEKAFEKQLVFPSVVVRLIRAEHKAIVRLVKAELAYRVERNRDPNEVTDVSGISACTSLLAALARRAR